MTLVTRIAPALPLRGRRAVRLIERNSLVYRRTWIVILSGFFEPLFYLLGIGFGLGSLIGGVTGPDGREISYGVFVAPALLATSAMNGAIYETTFNVFFKLKYQKTYDVMLNTPLGVGDVALGEVVWALIRGLLYSLGFLVVMLLLGLALSPLVLLAPLASLLMGFAFSAVGMSVTTYLRKWTDFDLVFVVTMPLFLFSATFFPLSAYPESLQLIVQLTPLYHGVNLLRGLTTGVVGVAQVVDVVYLAVMALLGLIVVNRRLNKLLIK